MQRTGFLWHCSSWALHFKRVHVSEDVFPDRLFIGYDCFMLRTLVLLSYKMYSFFFVLCRPAGVMGPGVSCCAHW